MPRRCKPTPRRDLIVEALALGVNTSDRIADLLGVSRQLMTSELNSMAKGGRVRCAGTVRENRQGPRRKIWRSA